MGEPLENLSVSWNATLASSAGIITKGRALTKDVDGKYVLATTANRAVQGGAVYAIALQDGRADQSVRAAHIGWVPASVVGALTGTGNYVNVQTDGTLARSAAIGVDTIADYLPDGSVVVSLNYQRSQGGSGNATAIQSIPVSSAVATRSWGLFGDGTNQRVRRDVANFLDWSPAGDGVTSDAAKLQAAITSVGPCGELFIPTPSSGLGYLIDDTIEAHNDTASGNLRGLHIFGDQGHPFTPTKPTFLCAVPCPSGLTADITAYGNGGSGDFMQTISLGAASGVTVALKEKFIGRGFRIWNAATKVHNGEFFVVDVPSDNTVIIYQPYAGAAASDANDGSIRWRIYRSAFDVRMSEFTIERLAFNGAVGRFGAMLEVGEPFRAGAGSVNQFHMHCLSFTATQSTRIHRYGILMAKNIVPRLGNSRYTVNGAGVPQVAATVQVDASMVSFCGFRGMDEIGWCHSSPNGQSREIQGHKIQFGPSIRAYGGVYGGIGYGVPRNLQAAGIYSAEGSPGVYFSHLSLNCDLGLLFGGATSHPRVMHNVYSESAARVMRDPAQSTQVVSFVGGNILSTNTRPHPSRELIQVGGCGPLNFYGTMLQQYADNAKCHVVMQGIGGLVGRCTFVGCKFIGTTGYVGRYGRKVARLCGPFPVTSGETLTFVVDGVDVVVTHTAANFATAGIPSVNLNEVESWQLGKLWDFYLQAAAPSGAAWGEFDNAPPSIQTNTPGTGGSIDCRAGSGNLFTILDWPSAGIAFTGQAQTNMCIDSAGWCDSHGSGAGTEPAVIAMSFVNCDAATIGGARVVLPEGTIHYGSGVAHNTIVGGICGSFTAVTGGAITVVGAVVTIADVRVTANTQIALKPTNAAAVTLGASFRSARTAGTSIAVTFGGAPAGTETFDYELVEPT